MVFGFGRGRRGRALFASRARGAVRSLLAALPLVLAASAALANNALVVQNLCTETIWIQQQNMNPAGGGVNNPVVVELAPKASHTYAISSTVATPSVALWPKTGCDSTGQNCKTGQQAAPCPPAGCTYPIASMPEVTFVPGTSGQTFIDASMVNGFSLPVSIVPSKNAGHTSNCTPAVCPTITETSCPTTENLSSNGAFPAYKSVNLRLYESGAFVGCMAPCAYLTKVVGLQPTDAAAAQYCCQGPVYGQAAACKAGPVATTKYVSLIHKACVSEVYAYPYDDANGTHSCIGSVTITATFCPPVPK